MEKNVIGIVGIKVEQFRSVDEMNAVLHNYGEDILCRQGIPLNEREVSVLSIIIDAPKPVIEKMADEIAHLDGVTVEKIFFE